MAMIKIFNATDTDFSSAGNITIEPLKCREFKKKSLNGWYIEVEIPIKYKEYIKEDKLVVIQTKSKLRPQAFRITADLKTTTKKISFTANHVMFDAERYFLLDVRPTNLNGLNGLNYINQRTDIISPFTMYSNVENVSTAYFIRKNLLEAWQVFEERWQGVFDADNWDISFLQNVGHDNGESIIYGKNAQGVEIYEDWSNVVTKLYPVGYDGIMLPEKYIESDIQYELPYTKTIDFTTELDEEERTQEGLIAELRTNAYKYLEENKVPKICYTIRSDINDKMEIGDTIQILHPLVSIKTEVLEYEYDIILKKVKSLTFGNYSRDVKTKFNNIRNTINEITTAISKQDIAIKKQTELINLLNKNGYVYIDDNEILILDKLPKEEAKNVWRWGLGGLGFSSNGYEGPFETAMTMDGQINANFITTGTLQVSRIEGLADDLLAINIELGKIESSISDIADITTSKESSYGTVSFEKINQSEPIRIEVRPLGTNISYLYPRDNLYPSDDLFMPDRILRFKNTTTNEIFDYELPDDLLYYDADNFDEFILDYDSQTCVVNKKVGYNADGTTYVLSNPQTITYTYPTIELTDGDYTVSLPGYSSAYLFVRLMAQNIYTTQFETRAEARALISETAQSINLSVDKKLSNYSTTTEMNAAINLKANEINLSLEGKLDEEEFTGANIMLAINNDSSSATIKADKIDLNGKQINLTSDNITINSNNFSVDKNGNITANGGTIAGWTIEGLKLRAGDGNNIKTVVVQAPASNNNWVFAAGGTSHSNYGDCPFRVNKNGELFATNANISGTITTDCFNVDNSGKVTINSTANSYTGAEMKLVGNTVTNHLYASAVAIKKPNSIDGMAAMEVVQGQGTMIVTAENGGFIQMVAGQGISVVGGDIGTTDNISATGTVTGSNIQSDRRLKKNIKDSTTNALEVIKQIEHREFDWKKDDKHINVGYIAQELEKIDENFVIKQNDTYYVNLLPILATTTKAIQEQQEQIENLEARIAELEGVR